MAIKWSPGCACCENPQTCFAPNISLRNPIDAYDWEASSNLQITYPPSTDPSNPYGQPIVRILTLDSNAGTLVNGRAASVYNEAFALHFFMRAEASGGTSKAVIQVINGSNVIEFDFKGRTLTVNGVAEPIAPAEQIDGSSTVPWMECIVSFEPGIVRAEAKVFTELENPSWNQVDYGFWNDQLRGYVVTPNIQPATAFSNDWRLELPAGQNWLQMSSIFEYLPESSLFNDAGEVDLYCGYYSLFEIRDIPTDPAVARGGPVDVPPYSWVKNYEQPLDMIFSGPDLTPITGATITFTGVAAECVFSFFGVPTDMFDLRGQDYTVVAGEINRMTGPGMIRADRGWVFNDADWGYCGANTLYLKDSRPPQLAQGLDSKVSAIQNKAIIARAEPTPLEPYPLLQLWNVASMMTQDWRVNNATWGDELKLLDILDPGAGYSAFVDNGVNQLTYNRPRV